MNILLFFVEYWHFFSKDHSILTIRWLSFEFCFVKSCSFRSKAFCFISSSRSDRYEKRGGASFGKTLSIFTSEEKISRLEFKFSRLQDKLSFTWYSSIRLEINFLYYSLLYIFFAPYSRDSSSYKRGIIHGIHTYLQNRHAARLPTLTRSISRLKFVSLYEQTKISERSVAELRGAGTRIYRLSSDYSISQ